MGEKGAKQSASGGEAAASLVAALQPLGAITSKKMFGGHGVCCDGVMFALVTSTGIPHLRADAAAAEGFEAAGSGRHGKMPYWSIPEATLNAPDDLLAAARKALETARRARA